MNSKILLSMGIVIVLGILALQNNRIDDLNKDKAVLTAQYSELLVITEKERNIFKDTVDRLNKEINRFKIDTDKYTVAVKDKTTKVTHDMITKEEYVKKELIKDSSSSNQLNIINRMLHEFSNTNN